MTFKLLEAKQLHDIQSEGRIYEHEETGAKVLRLANDDPNKAFTISFKTPPYSDNGIAHILEHSVLNGSKKYPSKEPFVELIKGSLNTFVNAMTFSDKTIYPVASTNQQDFENLMGVYLDAVFEPNFRDNPQILEQEGWHYHLESAEEELIYKGVVYNEMKGANASPERQLSMFMRRHLYPNTPYAFDSGGYSPDITSLTQDEFINFHERYYHPSNSLTILYGDLDEQAAFEDLAEYFNGMGKLDDSIELAFESQIPEVSDLEETYSLAEGDDPKEKDYLALAWHTNTVDKTLDYFGFSILTDILFDNNDSPLKKALLDAEIGGDISADFSQIGYVEAFSIVAKFAQSERMDDFKRVVKEVLSQLVKDGIPSELVEASLNKHLFHLKEAAISESNPRGVIYAIGALKSWLYGYSPFERIEFSDALDRLKGLAKEGYFEELIESKLLDNPHRVALTLKADPGKSDRQETKALEDLKAYKESLTDEEVEALVVNTKALLERQEQADKTEDLEKIPRLSRDDLTTETSVKDIIVSELFQETFFNHADEFTSGIDYLNLYFDISDFKQTDYEALGFLSDLLGSLPTERYSVAELQTQIDLNTGGIHANIVTFDDPKTKQTKPYMVISGKALEDSLDALLVLMEEILCRTKWQATEDILNLTQSYISGFNRQIDFSSHALAASRAMSQVKVASKLNEQTSGLDQYHYLLQTRDSLKNKKSTELSKTLESLAKQLMNQQRMHALYVGDKNRVEQVKARIRTVFEQLPSENIGEKAVLTMGNKQKEAYLTAQDVNYVGQAANTLDILPYSGPANVLTTMLRFDYLWNNIRVKGGAYGAIMQMTRSGGLALVSYRDPNIMRTLETYQGLPAYIAEMSVNEAELFKAIIGTMSNLDQPLSAYHRGLKSFTMLQTSYAETDIIRLKEEILATTLQDLNAMHTAFDTLLTNPATVVIGNKAQIEAVKEQFDVIKELY